MEAGPPTLARTGFADRGRQIDTDALREIYFAVRSSIDGLADRAWETLGILPPDAIEIELYVELPDRSAGELGRALDAVDLTWRLGWMVAEMGEAELPDAGGSTNLDELLPIERIGLEVDLIEIGSIKTWLSGKGAAFDRALATLGLLVSLSGFDAQEAFFADTHRASGGSCQVEVVSQLGEQANRVIRDQLPGLPADCLVKAKISFPDGTVIYANVPAGALTDR